VFATLEEEQLLAKLSAGDTIAQEFKYHSVFLMALYKRERERDNYLMNFLV
jgi:hypothetical protein